MDLQRMAQFEAIMALHGDENTQQQAPPDGNVIVVTADRPNLQLPNSPLGAPIFAIGNVIINPADFDPDVDHCGSSSNGTEWLPESIGSVDISWACFVHDQLYGPGSSIDRLEADQIFRNHIYNMIIDSYRGGVSQDQSAIAWLEANGVYQTVRVFAEGAYEGSGDPS